MIYNVLAGRAPMTDTFLLKKFVHICLFVVYLPCFCEKAVFWPVRLGVRTQDFHSCNTGSIPVRATEATLLSGLFFCAIMDKPYCSFNYMTFLCNLYRSINKLLVLKGH